MLWIDCVADRHDCFSIWQSFKAAVSKHGLPVMIGIGETVDSCTDYG